MADFRRFRLSAAAAALVALAAAIVIAAPGTTRATPINSSARPYGIAYRKGSLYISDAGENVIRKLNPLTGKETIIAGVPGPEDFSGDGPATSMHLCSPEFLSFDHLGDLYFADRGVNRIRKLAAGLITTVAGSSTTCGFSTGAYSGDGGPATAAELDSPAGVGFDAVNNMFISDTYNHRIREVSRTTGTITTVAGSGSFGSCCVGGFSGDGGPAVAAQLFQPHDIFVDTQGDIVFADNYNNRIRKVSPSGIITTVAGSTPIHSGHCDPHKNVELAKSSVLCGPAGLSYDGSAIFFTDFYNNQVRKIAVQSHVVLPVAGSGPAYPSSGGYSGDGGLALRATLRYALDIAVDEIGDVYIADTENHVIRKVNPLGVISTVPGFGSAG